MEGGGPGERGTREVRGPSTSAAYPSKPSENPKQEGLLCLAHPFMPPPPHEAQGPVAAVIPTSGSRGTARSSPDCWATWAWPCSRWVSETLLENALGGLRGA